MQQRIMDGNLLRKAMTALFCVALMITMAAASVDTVFAEDTVAYVPEAQGKDNTVTILSPTGITFSEKDDYYWDVVEEPFKGNTVYFGFTMSRGINNFGEGTQFINNNMHKINVYDSYPEGKKIASYDTGKAAEVNYIGFKEDTKTITISLTGLPNGTYTLVFDADVCGNSPDKIIGKPIAVEFSVTESTNPPLPVEEDPADTTEDCQVSSFDELKAAVNGLSAASEKTTVISITNSFAITETLYIPEGAKVEIKSSDATAPAVISRGTELSLINVKKNTELALSDIIIDGNLGEYSEASSLIYSTGSVTINDGAVLRNNAASDSNGGAVLCIGGSLNMKGGEITGNQARFGAGVYLNNKTSFTMDGGKIASNNAKNGCGVFVTGNGTLFTMNGGTITGNEATDIKGGGVYIVLDGKFVMNGGTISNNVVNEANSGGGGVYADNGGSFLMKGGMITGNQANDGAGVYVLQENSSFIMEGGIICRNKALTGGGGVYTVVIGAFTMNGGLITENEAQAGGGVGMHSGPVTINSGTISNNTADWGGGVYYVSGELTMNGGSISGNKAVVNSSGYGGMGGGVYSTSLYNCFTFNGGDIENNTAEQNGGGVYFTGTSNTILMDGGRIAGNTAQEGSWIYVDSAYNKLVILKDTLIPENESLYNEGSLVIDGGVALTNLGSITQMGQIGGNKIPLTQENSGDYRNWTDPGCNGIVNGMINGEMKYFISDMEISGISGKVYTGKQLEQSITIKNGKTVLSENTDYKVTYSGNIYPGTATVTIEGLGDYTGVATRTFIISAPDLKAPAKVSVNLYGYDKLKASWSKVNGATGYYVYYKKSTWDSYQKLGTTTGLSFSKANLADGAKYSFRIYPYIQLNGKDYVDKSYKSSDYVYTLKKLSKPAVKKSSGSYVKITWNNIPGESGYQIAKSTSKTKGFKVVKTVNYKYKSFKLKTSKNKTYYYKVRAYKTVNGKKIYGPWSSVKSYKLK